MVFLKGEEARRTCGARGALEFTSREGRIGELKYERELVLIDE